MHLVHLVTFYRILLPDTPSYSQARLAEPAYL